MQRHIESVRNFQIMAQYTFSAEAFSKASGLISRYFGIEITNQSQCKDGSITLDTSLDLNEIRKAYAGLPSSSPNDSVIQDALLLLSDHVKSTAPMPDENSADKITKRQDMLRLYVFCEENSNSHEDITIRSRTGSIRLANSRNWLYEKLAKPYLQANLATIASVDEAKKELLTGRRSRGRKPNDPRVPALLWGIYGMLSELHGFDSLMPNTLCNFIIRLLQIQGVFPPDTEIDTLWVRAELRYIRSRPVKPKFPIREG